jgi:hypothetical protein
MHLLFKPFIVAIVSLLLPSCSTSNLHETYCPSRAVVKKLHPLDASKGCDDTDWLPYRSCGYDFWNCERYRKVWTNDSDSVVQAKENFKYAMMANNSYRHDKDTIFYEIPGWTQVSRMESDSGLALDVYKRLKKGKVVELAVVYEGTNFSHLNDWKFNFALIPPNQYIEARSHLEALKARYPGVPITAVGHSLGGGLALNMSMLFDGVNAVGFNASPRAFWGNENPSNSNQRIYNYESGEILTSISRAYMRARLSDAQMKRVRYNFLDFTNLTQPIHEHSMYYISRGLILVAIKGGSTEAAKAFVKNFNLHENCERCREIRALAGEKSNRRR